MRSLAFPLIVRNMACLVVLGWSQVDYLFWNCRGACGGSQTEAGLLARDQHYIGTLGAIGLRRSVILAYPLSSPLGSIPTGISHNFHAFFHFCVLRRGRIKNPNWKLSIVFLSTSDIKQSWKWGHWEWYIKLEKIERHAYMNLLRVRWILSVLQVIPNAIVNDLR